MRGRLAAQREEHPSLQVACLAAAPVCPGAALPAYPPSLESRLAQVEERSDARDARAAQPTPAAVAALCAPRMRLSGLRLRPPSLTPHPCLQVSCCHDAAECVMRGGVGMVYREAQVGAASHRGSRNCFRKRRRGPPCTATACSRALLRLLHALAEAGLTQQASVALSPSSRLHAHLTPGAAAAAPRDPSPGARAPEGGRRLRSPD